MLNPISRGSLTQKVLPQGQAAYSSAPVAGFWAPPPISCPSWVWGLDARGRTDQLLRGPVAEEWPLEALGSRCRHWIVSARLQKTQEVSAGVFACRSEPFLFCSAETLLLAWFPLLLCHSCRRMNARTFTWPELYLTPPCLIFVIYYYAKNHYQLKKKSPLRLMTRRWVYEE